MQCQQRRQIELQAIINQEPWPIKTWVTQTHLLSNLT